jgi:hypothetical protein
VNSLIAISYEKTLYVTAGEPQHVSNYALHVQHLPVLPHSARPKTGPSDNAHQRPQLAVYVSASKNQHKY